MSSCKVEGTLNVCAPREKKQGSPAKAPGVDGGVGGLLQSSDAMTEAMSSTGLWRGGGVGGKKRMWLPAVRAGGSFRCYGLPEPKIPCSAVECSGGLVRPMDALEARSRCWLSNCGLPKFLACLRRARNVGAKVQIFLRLACCNTLASCRVGQKLTSAAYISAFELYASQECFDTPRSLS